MSKTASFDEKKVHSEVPNEGGDGSGGTLELEGPSHNNNNSGDQGTAPVGENSESPSKNAAATLNEESERPASVEAKQPDEAIENLVALFRDFLEAASNSATANFTHTQRNTARRKRPFGLNKGSSPETGLNNRYDYEQKYPRDRPGEEAADNARVWSTYLDEAESFDREKVDGWKETADILLVFAGLFSGVITIFVSQASQSLRQDNTQVSASLLFEIVQLLRAQFNGTLINDIPNSTLTPTSPFTPSKNVLWVNGLLFVGLAITLSTALFATLAKQWLYYYLTSIPGTLHEKVRARHLRFKGFELWKVGTIIDLLPIPLHLAVGFFLAAIIVLLYPLEIHLSRTIIAITTITYFLYLISVIFPIWYPGCPYTTSLTICLGALVCLLQTILSRISETLKKGFQAVWRRANFKAKYTIHRLLHYTQDLFRRAFKFISKFVDVVRRGFRKYRPTIFDGFPKFTNWREENIKKAVKDAISLDYDALNWLYATYPNMSVYRIIARCVAVHPIISQKFERDILDNLQQTLEVSETNIVDLHYGLCLDLLARVGWCPNHVANWSLLRSIPDVEGSQLEEAEYRSYSHITENIINRNYHQIIKDAIINDDLKFPLAMWRRFFDSTSVDATVVAHILTSARRGLFTRRSTCNTGVVSLNNEELGWSKFEYLYHCFVDNRGGLVDDFETRYHLLFTIYRNLTSSTSQPLIADEEQRWKSLLNLFQSFKDWLGSKPCVSSEQYFTFFIDIYCVDAFWSELMSNGVRAAAAECLDLIWNSMNADVVRHFLFTKCHDLTLIYQWCSQDLGDPDFSWCTSPIFTRLFMSPNRPGLRTILSNDSHAVSNFSTCLKNLEKCDINSTEDYLYQSLMDLFKSVDPNRESPFTILYESSVLINIWKFLPFHKLDEKEFFSILKSKLDPPQKLRDLYDRMIVEAQSEQETKRRSALEASARVFGLSIGVISVKGDDELRTLC